MSTPKKSKGVTAPPAAAFANTRLESHSPGVTTTPENLLKFRSLVAPHVAGFDYFLTKGLAAISPSGDKAGSGVPKVDVEIFDQSKAADVRREDVPVVSMWMENLKVVPPETINPTTGLSTPLLPRHCRELATTYAGSLYGDFCYQITLPSSSSSTSSSSSSPNSSSSESRVIRTSRKLGDLPIMVGSRACHTYKASPSALVSLREESLEFGGHFIVTGIERCIRLLQVPRRNHPLAISRPTYRSRGPLYTPFGVASRNARANGDCSSISNTLHYLSSGGVTLRFACRKQEFLLPLVVLLRCLRPGVTDSEISARAIGAESARNTFLVARVELLLHDAKHFGLVTQEECLAFVGQRFRALSGRGEFKSSDVECGRFMIEQYIAVHLTDYEDKMEYLIFMLRKLYNFVQGKCGGDNADSMQNLEILMPGHLICAFVKEKIEECMMEVRKGVMIEMRKDFGKVLSQYTSSDFWKKALDRYGGGCNVGKKVAHFLSTGNIISSTGLDLMQVSGYTIVAERLNFLRYISHYRSVHRGQFFTTMKTTAVRKLLPDSWGFMCPVHTPDGGPCGLLNHLASPCEVMTHPASLVGGSLRPLDAVLIDLGVTPCGAGGSRLDGNRVLSADGTLPVLVDGRVVGGGSVKDLKRIAAALRVMKVEEKPQIPPTTEVTFFPPTPEGSGPYPGLFLFTGAARVIRPVLQRATGKVEYIGAMEQPFMDIACLPEDVREGVTTHIELDPTNMLSLIASMTPFSDYNQSPRNMYQCQMGKQTMGTPFHSLPYRTDNKVYRIHNPQAPVVSTKNHRAYRMDDHPNGCNAVVAVLSYTGYDMEDSVILCKSSYERGFGHASVYKTKVVDLKDEGERAGATMENGKPRLRFTNRKPAPKGGGGAGGRTPRKGGDAEQAGAGNDELYDDRIGEDGLPIVGSWVSEGDPLYCYVDDLTGKEKIGKHKEYEKACVQTVRLLGDEKVTSKGGAAKEGGLQRVSITLRIPRNPVIGDKFSSRHGQKGVMSILWPQVDMPFSESGISPDIIINPHAFPSRMTIGMLIESMAGKAGALHGMSQDATPFSFHESGSKLAIDHFGEQLQSAGYSYYGSEPLYSGVSGQLLQADLYIGVVYYQRLRHMVSDKAQVRATGQVNQLTRQPVKGRKRGGGIRLGEMERDALLSHGTAFLLLDRLMNCSDRHVAHCCARCGGILAARTARSAMLSAGGSSAEARLTMMCANESCKDEVNAVEPIALPYVFKYLSYELAGMGIKMTCEI